MTSWLGKGMVVVGWLIGWTHIGLLLLFDWWSAHRATTKQAVVVCVCYDSGHAATGRRADHILGGFGLGVGGIAGIRQSQPMFECSRSV